VQFSVIKNLELFLLLKFYLRDHVKGKIKVVYSC